MTDRPGDTKDAKTASTATTQQLPRLGRPRVSSIYSFKTDELDGGVESSRLSADELAAEDEGQAEAEGSSTDDTSKDVEPR